MLKQTKMYNHIKKAPAWCLGTTNTLANTIRLLSGARTVQWARTSIFGGRCHVRKDFLEEEGKFWQNKIYQDADILGASKVEVNSYQERKTCHSSLHLKLSITRALKVIKLCKNLWNTCAQVMSDGSCSSPTWVLPPSREGHDQSHTSLHICFMV